MTAKCIKVVYNTLLDRYISLEFGEPQTTLSQQIQADVTGGIMQQVPETVKRIVAGDPTKITMHSAQIAANSSKTFTVANGTKFAFFTMNAAASGKGLYISNTNTSGTISTTAVLAASAITESHTTNSLTLTSSASAVVFVYFLVFAGSVSNS